MSEPNTTDPVKPSIEAAVRHFETVYDLRLTADGELFARPTEASGLPMVVIDADELAHRITIWWRDAAQTWNASLPQGRDEGAGGRS